MKRFLSWDCGNKTLAWADISVQLPITTANAAERLSIRSAGVVDLLNGKKVQSLSSTEKTKCLHNWLMSSHLRADLIPSATTILIEQQPRVNVDATIISWQLAFHYANHRVIFVSPKNKDKIDFHPSLSISNLEQITGRSSRGKAGYTTRKKHSKLNVLYLLSLPSTDNQTKATLSTTPPNLLNNIGDAILQTVAFALTIAPEDPTPHPVVTPGPKD